MSQHYHEAGMRKSVLDKRLRMERESKTRYFWTLENASRRYFAEKSARPTTNREKKRDLIVDSNSGINFITEVR